MKDATRTQIDSYNEFSKQVSNAISSYEFFKRFAGISLFVMLVFGILFWCILFGLFFAFILLALLFDPAYQLFRKLLNAPNLPQQLVKPPLSRFFYGFISLIFPGFFVFIGVGGFSSIGICTQSPACILVNLVRGLF